MESPDYVMVNFSKYLLIAFCAAMWVVVNKFLMKASYFIQKTPFWMIPVLLGIFSDVAAAGIIIYWVLGGCTTIAAKGMYLALAIFCGLSVLLCKQEKVKEEDYEKD